MKPEYFARTNDVPRRLRRWHKWWSFRGKYLQLGSPGFPKSSQGGARVSSNILSDDKRLLVDSKAFPDLKKVMFNLYSCEYRQYSTLSLIYRQCRSNQATTSCPT